MCTPVNYTLEQTRKDLDKNIIQTAGMSERNDMRKRIREAVTVKGKTRYLSGYTYQEICDNYVNLLINEGLIEWVSDGNSIPLFSDCLDLFYRTFKQDQQQNTIINRERIVRIHINPVFGQRRIDKISVSDLQQYFNQMGKKYSHETLLKIKNIMSPVFDAAVEDGYLAINPIKSKRLIIGGTDTIHHKAIPRSKYNEMKTIAPVLKGNERMMLGLLCYTGMRFEEILGIRWEDLDENWIFVKRAVVHPTRNLPEIKDPKTKTSERLIPLVPELSELLNPKYKHGFIIHSNQDSTRETPLSYSEARRVFDKIRKRFKIEEYTAHDFRDTCATEWRENGMPLDLIARILGHAKTETTEKRYVKYRTDLFEKAKELMEPGYFATVCQQETLINQGLEAN